MKTPFLARAALGLATLVCAFGAGAQTSPYAGEQARAVKALDARELNALREGQGLGFAKAAELNGYPGPLHVLELATALALSDTQRAATEALMQAHKGRARALGTAVIDAETALDRLFAEGAATPPRVVAATQRIAALQAELRAEHLNSHLAQTALLTAAQAERYAVLRGYGDAAAPTPHAPSTPGAGVSHRH